MNIWGMITVLSVYKTSFISIPVVLSKKWPGQASVIKI